MIDRFKKSMLTEGAVVAGFLVAGVVWFVVLTWVVPFAYEILSRRCTNDYAYLWNGFAGRLRGIARPGALVIFMLAPAWLILRLIRRGIRFSLGRAVPAPRRRRLSPGELFAREAWVIVGIVLIATVTFYFSHRGYVKLKERYFSQVVMSQDGYRFLPESEKAKARSQYDATKSTEYVAGMLKDYGMRAKIFYYSQLVTFWMLIWGYPGYLLFRFLFWAKRKLDLED
jgi:hypothetical protein